MHDFSIYYLKYSFNLFKTTCEEKIFIIFAPSEYLVTFVVRDQVGLVFLASNWNKHTRIS